MLHIRDIRKSQHMTMKELGKKVGVSESAIQLYETQKRKPDYEMLLKLSEALDCTVVDLLYGFSKPPEPPDPDEIPFNPPDEIADLWNAWDQVTPEDKAIIRIIADKYKGNSDNG